jgi:hypothetical protein
MISKASHRARSRVSLGLGLFALALASGGLGLVGSACGDGAGSGTTGERVRLHTRIDADPEIRGAFVTSVGWRVTLTKAAVAVGALYYFDGAPAFVRLDAPPNATHRLTQWLGVREAEAHPGHYASGDAVGEMLTASSVDLLGEPAMLADGDGITGAYRSARFVFPASPTGPLAATLGGHVAIAEGSAVKADGSDPAIVHFRVSADEADVAKEASQGQVEGCAFDPEADVASDGTITVTVRPSVWFELVDFTDVAPGSADAPTELAPGEVARAAFVLGVTQLSAYRFKYSAK